MLASHPSPPPGPDAPHGPLRPPASGPGRRTPAGRRWLRDLLIVGSVAAIAVTGLVIVNTRGSDAGAVVERFFAAILDRDVEAALALTVPSEVPYGAPAAFLHPDAIDDDWEVVAVRGSDNGSAGEYTVTVDDGESQADGTVAVSHVEPDGWRVRRPFVEVTFTSIGLTYGQANDRVVEPARSHPYEPHDPSRRYHLLPGRYTFFSDLAEVTGAPRHPRWLMPDAGRAQPTREVGLPAFTFTDELHAAAQEWVNELIDECAGDAVRAPAYCGFQARADLWNEALIDELSAETDGPLDYSQLRDQEVRDIHNLSWQVVEYPTVRLVDRSSRHTTYGLEVAVEEPGLIELSGTGHNPVEGEIDFIAYCTVDDGTALHIGGALRPDGTVDFTHPRRFGPARPSSPPSPQVYTCSYAPEQR